jgi:hypothetical protein
MRLTEVVDDAVLATTKRIGFDEGASERDYFVVVHPPLAAPVLTAEPRHPHTREDIADFHGPRCASIDGAAGSIVKRLSRRSRSALRAGAPERHHRHHIEGCRRSVGRIVSGSKYVTRSIALPSCSRSRFSWATR